MQESPPEPPPYCPSIPKNKEEKEKGNEQLKEETVVTSMVTPSPQKKELLFPIPETPHEKESQSQTPVSIKKIPARRSKSKCESEIAPSIQSIQEMGKVNEILSPKPSSQEGRGKKKKLPPLDVKFEQSKNNKCKMKRELKKLTNQEVQIQKEIKSIEKENNYRLKQIKDKNGILENKQTVQEFFQKKLEEQKKMFMKGKGSGKEKRKE